MPQKATKSTSKAQNKLVYTSGAKPSDFSQDEGAFVGVGTDSKVHQMKSVAEPLPGQLRTFQRGLAKAAMKLPTEREQVQALAETLAAMDLLRRVL